MAKNLQERIVAQAEKYLDIKIIDIKIPPQGMDSQVFFVKDMEGREYVVKCSAKILSGDAIALKLLKENKNDVPVPKILGVLDFEDKQAVIMEKIDFPLLESVPASDMGKYIPSMIHNLKRIHGVKSDKAGSLTNIDSGLNWKDVMLSKFTGADSQLDWNKIAFRKGLDSGLVLDAVEKIIRKIENTEFISGSYSLLHTDFNQRNLFVDPNSDQIAGIIDWEEAMFGDPIYDFARIRMYIWHFNLSKGILEEYYSLLSFSEEQKNTEELYWLSRVVEYLAYYSEDLNDFNQ